MNQPIPAENVGGLSASKLKSFIDRVERAESEKSGLAADIRDIYLEAKSQGFDAKIMRKIVAMRKKNASARREEAELLELYKSALGMSE